MFKSTHVSKVALRCEFLKRMGTLAGILSQAMPKPRRRRRAIDRDGVALKIAEGRERANLAQGTEWVDLSREFLKLSAAVVPLYPPFPENLWVHRSEIPEVLHAGNKVFPVRTNPRLAPARSHLCDTETNSMVYQWAQLRTEVEEIVEASIPRLTSDLISGALHELKAARLCLETLDGSVDLCLSLKDWTTLRWRCQACDDEVNSMKGYVRSEEQKVMVTEGHLNARGNGGTSVQDREMACSENPISLEETISRLGIAQESFLTLRQGIDREFTAQEWFDLKAQTYASCQLSVPLINKTSGYHVQAVTMGHRCPDDED